MVGDAPAPDQQSNVWLLCQSFTQNDETQEPASWRSGLARLQLPATRRR